MNTRTNSLLRKNIWEFLLILVALTVFFVCSQPGSAESALYQETDLIQADQYVVYQPKLQKPATVTQAKTVAPIQAITFLAPSRRVSRVAKKVPIAAVLLPAFGQRIVSFLTKSQTCHKASEDPYLLFC